MKIKLKDKKIKVPIGLCFRKTGYDQTLIDEINSGKSVEVDRIHPSAKELVSEVKKPKGDK